MSTPVDPDKQPLGATDQRSIGQLVSDVSTDVSQIMRGELDLAKAEIKQDVMHAGKGAGMFAGAGVLGLYGLGLLFLGLAGVIAIWLPWWAGLLIMAALLFVVAGILALIGKKQVSQVKGKPEKAIGEGKETVETVKASAAHGKERSPDGSTTAPAPVRTPAGTTSGGATAVD